MASSAKQQPVRSLLFASAALLMMVGASVWLAHRARTGTAQSHLGVPAESNSLRATTAADERALERAKLPAGLDNPLVAALVRTDVRIDPGSNAPGHFDRERETSKRASDDPVAAAIPMLSHRTKAQQLRTLRWMDSIPGEKLVSAFPGLMDSHVPLADREQVAREWLATLIRDLEHRHEE